MKVALHSALPLACVLGSPAGVPAGFTTGFTTGFATGLIPGSTMVPTTVWQEYGQALWRFESPEVQIGQPWSCTLLVVHDSADRLPEKLKAPFASGEDWVLLDGPTLRGQALTEGGWQSQATWTYMALQPGDHSTEGYTLKLERGSEIAPAPARLTVLTELTAEEQAPRPLAETLPAPPEGGGQGYLWVGALLIAAICAWVFLRRKPAGSGQPGGEPVSPLTRLQQARWSEANGREQLFEWHRDLRRVVDQARGESRGAWTDEEWIAAGPGASGMSSARWQEWCSLLSELEQLKYEAHLPSRLTAEELEVRIQRMAALWAQERSGTPAVASQAAAPARPQGGVPA